MVVRLPHGDGDRVFSVLYRVAEEVGDGLKHAIPIEGANELACGGDLDATGRVGALRLFDGRTTDLSEVRLSRTDRYSTAEVTSGEIQDVANHAIHPLCRPRDGQHTFPIRAERDGPDVLIYNAGSGIWKTAEELSPAEFEQSFKVNALGLLSSAQQVLPGMRSRPLEPMAVTDGPSVARLEAPGSRVAELVLDAS